MLVIALVPHAARGQTTAPSAPAPFRERDVLVQLADDTAPLRGRLLQMDAAHIVLRVRDETRDGSMPVAVTYPLERIRYIDVHESDSVLEGAILGALFLAACARWWCQQGTDSPPEFPRDVWMGAGLGALIGAGIDASNNKHERIYQAPARRASTALPSPTVAVRFTF
jgi:hypothetical protein